MLPSQDSESSPKIPQRKNWDNSPELWKQFDRVPDANRVQLIFMCSLQFSSVQLLNRVRLFATPWITAHQASLSVTNSWSSPRLTSIKLVMPSSHLILGRPLLVLPPIPTNIKVFSNESTLRMRWPKYWSFSFSIIPSKEISGLLSFRMDWVDLLAVQGTLKSLLQHHSSKASILRPKRVISAMKEVHTQSRNHRRCTQFWLEMGGGRRGAARCE